MTLRTVVVCPGVFTRCNMLINGATINGNNRKILRLTESEPALFTYLQAKHGWTDGVCDDVDWDAFCMAARSYSSTEVHLLKLVHHKLPMRKQVSQHQEWTKAECYYCAEPDTMDHLQRAKFRTNIRKSVHRYMLHRCCSPEFVSQFLCELDHWTTKGALESGMHNDAMKGQSAIGWRLLTRGFLTRRWHTLLQRGL